MTTGVPSAGAIAINIEPTIKTGMDILLAMLVTGTSLERICRNLLL